MRKPPEAIRQIDGGYLTYDSVTGTAAIPNKEVSQEYVNAISTMDWISYDYQGNILLAGINYDQKTKTHTCVIEKVEK